MTYELFIDDERDPVRLYGERGSTMVVARTFDEAIAVVTSLGAPSFVAFDHDLGDGPSAFDFLRWLIERDLDTGFIAEPIRYNVHSANPVGAANITSLIDNYQRVKFG